MNTNTHHQPYITLCRGSQLVLEGRRVLVNGLSSDIGHIIGKALLENGALVAGTFYKHRTATDQLVQEYGDERVVAFPINLLDHDFDERVERIVKEVDDVWGGIDVLINCSGMLYICPALYDHPHKQHEIWRINYEGPFSFCRAALKVMFREKESKDIVNIASISGVRGGGQMASYSASKAALINLTKSLAEEFGPRNIKVNSISPGPVDTKILDVYLDRVSKELVVKNIPRGRLCTPLDVAYAVLGILMNDYLTGVNIVLHGGRL